MADEQKLLHYYLDLECPCAVVPDDESLFIKFPDRPGCMTRVEDAAENGATAEESRTLWIEGEYGDGHSIPEPYDGSGYSGKFRVRLPKSLHRDLAEQARREGVGLNAWVNVLLAERNLAAREPVEAR